MLHKNVNISIKDGINMNSLIKAILSCFDDDSEILKIFVFNDNSALVVEFDGICIIKYLFKDVNELIHCYLSKKLYYDYEIIEMI